MEAREARNYLVTNFHRTMPETDPILCELLANLRRSTRNKKTSDAAPAGANGIRHIAVGQLRSRRAAPPADLATPPGHRTDAGRPNLVALFICSN